MQETARRFSIAALVVAIVAGLVYVYVSRHQPPAGGMRLDAAESRAAKQGGPGGNAGPGTSMAAGRPGGPAFSQMPVAVVTAAAENEPWAVEIEALGTARANEAADLTSKTTNTVAAVRFAEGQVVRKGQVLVELDGAQARADLAAAQAALIESRATYGRSRNLFAQAALSHSQLDQIEAALKSNEARVAAAESRLADTVIRAPFDGRTGLRRVSVGALVSPGTVITTVDDTSVMKVDFDVPETFLSVLTAGLEVTVMSVAYPGRSFDGKVASVDSRVDPVTRSVKVRALLPNPEGLLRQGMFVSVRAARPPAPAVTIPEQALVPERGRVFVFVVAGGVAGKREVTTARRRPGKVEVATGLAAGERVVVEGTQKVRDGGPVTETPATAPRAGG